MESKLAKIVERDLEEASRIFSAMVESTAMHQLIANAARSLADTLEAGGKILLAGNGGSAADAQHIAAEFVNYFNFERPGLPAIALTTDSSILTSISNDSDFERVFARQIQAIGKPGDFFIAYSTSGTSQNIISAIDEAKKGGIKVLGLTGSSPGMMEHKCDFLFQTPSSSTARIQEGHLVIGHIISGIVESLVFDSENH